MTATAQTAHAANAAAVASWQPESAGGDVEMRRAPRKAMRLPATIKIEDIHDAMTCIVTEFSATGARIRLTEHDRIPFAGPASMMGAVTLYMPMERIIVVCRAVWRSKSELGLKFLTSLQHCSR